MVKTLKDLAQKTKDYFNPTTTTQKYVAPSGKQFHSPVPEPTRVSNFWTTPAAKFLARAQKKTEPIANVGRAVARPIVAAGKDIKRVWNMADNQGGSQPAQAQAPTPTPMPTVTPTPIQMEQPTPTPTPIPSHIKELPYEQRPYQKEIIDAWADQSNIANDILRYVDEEGIVRGENPTYGAGIEMDSFNRINPKTGKYDPNVPITKIKNALTGQMEDSIDRGLFRIHNGTFYDYRNRFPGLLDKYGIVNWDDLLDPFKCATMAKIIFNKQKEAWYDADPTSGARLE